MSERKEEESETTEQPKGRSKKKLIIVALLVLLLCGGGVGAFFAFSETEEGDAEEAEEEEEVVELPGAILPLEPFIVNLQVKGSFLKTSIQLQFVEPVLSPEIETEIPIVRDAIIQVLSSKTAAEILSAEGKEILREQLLEKVNEVRESDEIEAIYFTDFIVQ